jgi:hypothetical protein
MESLKSLAQLEGLLNGLLTVIGVLIAIAKFFFLTIWGWVIILFGLIAIILSKSRDRDGEFTFSRVAGGAAETLFWFYSNITAVLIGIVLLFFISTVFSSLKDLTKSLTLYRDVKMMEAALKNLSAERKMIELSAVTTNINQIPKTYVRIKYYAYSAVKDDDLFTGESSYIIEGKKIYVDFGVINFDYSLIEKGSAKNIAFPGKLFSDSVSADKGLEILAQTNGMPLSFKLDNQDIYIMDEEDYQDTVMKLISAATNEEQARKMGIRSHYGEAIGMYPAAGRLYSFYSTGAGGVVMR